VNFKQQVTAQIADAESGDSEEYRGQDWWQLMPEEELVFDIDFRRFPRSITAFMAFESFHDIVPPRIINSTRLLWLQSANGAPIS